MGHADLNLPRPPVGLSGRRENRTGEVGEREGEGEQARSVALLQASSSRLPTDLKLLHLLLAPPAPSALPRGLSAHSE